MDNILTQISWRGSRERALRRRDIRNPRTVDVLTNYIIKRYSARGYIKVGPYIVSFRNDDLRCNCKNYTEYQVLVGGYCKHIEAAFMYIYGGVYPARKD